MRRFVVRLSTLTSIVLALLAGGALFWVSQQVQQLEHEQRVLKQAITSEKEGIRVLNAEWDYLNRPERLEALVKQHLNTMEPVTPEDLLQDAKGVPEPVDLGDEDERTILVSTDKDGSKKSKAKPENKSDTLRAIPDARLIDDKSSGVKDRFGDVLDQETGSDE